MITLKKYGINVIGNKVAKADVERSVEIMTALAAIKTITVDGYDVFNKVLLNIKGYHFDPSATPDAVGLMTFGYKAAGKNVTVIDVIAGDGDLLFTTEDVKKVKEIIKKLEKDEE